MITQSRLDSLAELYSVDYQTNVPFPHIVIDNFIENFLLETVPHEYDSYMGYNKFDNKDELKFYSEDPNNFPPITKMLYKQFNSQMFCDFLIKLTGLKNVLFNEELSGGGMHLIRNKGKLGIHIDFNKKGELKRVLNVLFYLNKDWKEEYGGYLELHQMGEGGKMQAFKKIKPAFNRLVIFNTSEISYHGHPEPMTCPDNISRKSMASYFFQKVHVEDGHGTVFV